MNGNEHFTRAKSRLHNGTTNEVARAQAEATLALAYEQRTANLTAIWQTGDIKVGSETFGIMGEKRLSLYREIASRLGFEEQP